MLIGSQVRTGRSWKFRSQILDICSDAVCVYDDEDRLYVVSGTWRGRMQDLGAGVTPRAAWVDAWYNLFPLVR